MQLVEPQVFLIASTQLHEEGVVDWLSTMNGQAVLNHIAGEDEEKLIELCGRRCYLSFDVGLNPNVTKIRTNSQEYHKNLLTSGHGSVLEHSSATFAFENISRVFCYSEDMDVLTKDGWKPWKDITGHETFATLKEGELVYEKAEEYFKKQYTGKMYSVQSQQIDLLVTPDHRMWVQDIQTRKYRRNEQKFEIKLAKDILNKKNRYQKCANWKGNSQTKFCIDPVTNTGNEITREYNGCSIDTELFAKFLGFFISEGHLSNSDTSICIAQNEGETHDEIFNVITDMGFPVSSYKQGKANCKTIKFKCFALYEWLKKCGQGSLNKRIPREVLEWDKNLLLILYDAMLKGDGNKHKKNGHEVIYTSSVQLANDIQELLLKAGKSANIRVDKRIGESPVIKTGQVIKNKNINYVVSLVSNLYPHVNLHLDSKESNRWKKNNGFMDEFIDYEGNVYCVKVPSGLLYVRRNGKACWSGNTHEVVRHRAGVAVSQESLRYVRLNKLKFWIPPEIDANKDAREVFIDLIEKSEEAQAKLAKIFDIENLKSFSQKKVLTSAFRRIAPDGLATGIVLTFNMRALRHVIAMRTSVHAEVEIRKVFNKVFDIAIQEWPFIFQDFKKIDTGDGLFECVPEFAKV